MHRARLYLGGAMLVLAAGWGITIPLTKIAVSTGHSFAGLIFWQLVIGVLVMVPISLIRRRGLPLHRGALKTYLIIALIGTLVPNSASYQAIAHLPSGVVSVLMSLIPIIAFPIALGLRLEAFNPRRLAGLLVGLTGIMILILPNASLPQAALLAWIPVSLISVTCYAFEGNFVAKWGTGGADPIQVLLGASLVGALIAGPVVLATGTYISPTRAWGAPEMALVLSSVIHVLVYSGYVWMVGRAGPVFAVQISYPVTGFGIIWAMVLLGENYPSTFWVAMALVLAGVFLVQPKDKPALVPGAKHRQNNP